MQGCGISQYGNNRNAYNIGSSTQSKCFVQCCNNAELTYAGLTPDRQAHDTEAGGGNVIVVKLGNYQFHIKPSCSSISSTKVSMTKAYFTIVFSGLVVKLLVSVANTAFSRPAGAAFILDERSEEKKVDKWKTVRRQIEELKIFQGRAHGLGMISHGIVVAVGLMGMFAAVLGAMIGHRIPETEDDREGFAYWASDSDDDGWFGNGGQRESTYGPLRICDAV